MTLAEDIRAELLAGDCGAVDGDALTGFSNALAAAIMPYLGEGAIEDLTERVEDLEATAVDHEEAIDDLQDEVLVRETELQTVTASAVISGGTVTLTYTRTSKAIVLSVDTAITTLAIVAPPIAANRATNLNLTLVNAGGSIAAWSGVVWVGGTAHTLTSGTGSVDLLAAMYDGSTITMRFVASAEFPS